MAINFLLFQVGWFACVLGGAYGHEVLGSLIAMMIIAFHCLQAANPYSESRLLILALIVGVTFESLFTSLGLARYQYGQLHEDLAPHWMMLMWPLFATTLNLSMRWLKNMNTLLTAFAGAVSAPLAYYAGHRLGAVEYDDVLLSLGVISAAWAILLPVMVTMSQRFDGYMTSPLKTVSTEAT